MARQPTETPQEDVTPEVISVFLAIAPNSLWTIKGEPEAALDYAYQWAIWIVHYLKSKGVNVETLFTPHRTVTHNMGEVAKSERPGDLEDLAEFLCKSSPLTMVENGDLEGMRAWLDQLHARFNLLTLDGQRPSVEVQESDEEEFPEMTPEEIDRLVETQSTGKPVLVPPPVDAAGENV